MRRKLCLVWTLVLCVVARAHAASLKEDVRSISAIDAVAITVSDADQAVEFYSRVLTFEKVADREVAGEDYEHLFGVFGLRIRAVRMRLGEEYVELLQFLAPRGRPVPIDTQSNDLWSWQIIMRAPHLPALERSLRQSQVPLVSTNTVHLSDTALNWQDALIARDHDGHTTLISGGPMREARIPLEE